MTSIVIVGASLAGARAAETLRDKGFDGSITLVGEESELPYERPPLSKGYLLGEAERDSVFLHDAAWYDEKSIELRLGVAATGLDVAGHRLTLADGSELSYDKLLLATGAVVRRLDVPGADLDGVLYLRRLSDCEAIGGALRAGGRVVVVGAGWIGLEVAAAGRHHGADVTVVEVESLPLRRVLGDEVASVYADLHRAHGVDLKLGVGVQELRGSGRVSSVVLTDGTEVPADAVVVGVGVRPASDLASAAGVAVDDGVLVDASFRTSDPDVYAVGDVARVDHPVLGQRIRVEHWANALDGGPVAAQAMLGEDVRWETLPFFYSDQYDFSMEYAGYVSPGAYDEVVFRGDPAMREFVAFWVKDGRVLAGMNANVWDVSEQIQALVRSAKPVSREQLADPTVSLDDLAG